MSDARQSLRDAIAAASTIYIPGGSAELVVLQEVLAADPDVLAGKHLISCLIPGINTFDYAALHGRARLTTFMASRTLQASVDAGRTELLPLSYLDIAHHLRAAAPDLAILNVAPGAGDGFSFGICADFGPLVCRAAKLRLAVVNPAMPAPQTSATLPREAADTIVEAESPLLVSSPARADAQSAAIARNVAAFIPNGAVIETGIGGAPGAVWAELAGHKNLRVMSGIVGDGLMVLADSGALAPSGHIAGFAYGARTLYDRLRGCDLISFADVGVTHASALHGVEKFHAINSAIEVDLHGQCNLEWLGGRQISGVGGAPNFAAAARASVGGCAIIALPSEAKGVSRIVPRLDAPAVSLSRSDTHVFVTEHGIADVRGLAADARAAALISIAAPAHRDALTERWRANCC